MLQWLQENGDLLCICLGIVINALGLAYSIYKYLRAKGVQGAAELLPALYQAARRFECEAEATALKGEEKLAFVLERLRLFTAEQGVPRSDEELIAIVEADIAFSKEVNAPKSEVLE
jgi:hypothetical protein